MPNESNTLTVIDLFPDEGGLSLTDLKVKFVNHNFHISGNLITNERENLKNDLIKMFKRQGFKIVDGSLQFDAFSKEDLRKLNGLSIKFLMEKNKKFIEKYQDFFLEKYIVDGKSVTPKDIEPKLSIIDNEKKARLFRWIKLHWSIPVSGGYGRRLRYIVFDENTGGVIGIIGLGDPVYSLKDRDSFIGWSNEIKSKKLKHLMDAFVLGSVPPYNMLLGGKLIASLITSDKIFQDFKKKYKGKKSLIREEFFDGNLAAITTASALGKSSVYDRIKIPEGPQFIHVGWTRGSGDFHFLNGYYERLVRLVKSSGYTGKNKKWGSGIRSRRFVIRKALNILELPPKFQYHGIRREIFITPLGENWKKFLQGKNKKFKPYGLTIAEISNYIKKRWVIPRSERKKEYLEFKPIDYSLGCCSSVRPLSKSNL